MTNVIGRIRAFLVLDPWCIGAFTVSLVLGLGGLAVAGRTVAYVNQFDDFLRFHAQISPSTYYYPTASQVIALARASLRPDQVLVVIGGSSIMHGNGQGSAEVWTLALQRDLGDGFKVVNLAL